MKEQSSTTPVLLNSEKVIELNNKLSLVEMNKRLTIQQLKLFCFCLLKVDEETAISTFTKSEIEEALDIAQYRQKRFLQDIDVLQELKYKSFDKNFNFDWNGKGSIGIYLTNVEFENKKIICYFNKKYINSIMGLVEKYMTLDLNMLVHFKSSYSWYLYSYLKSKYQKNVHLKTNRISVEELKKVLKCDDVASYQSFKYFRFHVLELVKKEINDYTELNIEYLPIKKGRNISEIEFRWTIQPTTYSASTAQKEYINILKKELFSRNDFFEKEKDFAEYLTKIELNGLTKDNAKAIIQKAKDIITKLSGSKPKALDLDNEQTVEKIRIGVQDKLRETFSATAAEFFGGNFFDKGLEKAKENMEHKDSIQSVVIYITKAIKTMIYEEQKE